jgi:hypothetical protein
MNRRMSHGADQDLVDRIASMTRNVAADPDRIGVLSFSEQIAVALVLDRVDLLRTSSGTILQAVARLGAEWTLAAYYAQQQGHWRK